MAATQSTTSAKKSRAKAKPDAIALLKADHREVEGWFEQFEKARSEKKKQDLADKICTALKVHTQIEEEISIRRSSKPPAIRTSTTKRKSSTPARRT